MADTAAPDGVEPAVRRPDGPLAPPIVLERAFDDPRPIRALFAAGAPYKSLSAVHREPPGTPAAPWFRNFWALGGKVLVAGAESAFANPNFIAAARRSFGAEVVMPLAMMTNLNPPAPAAPPHLDLPFFRGAHRRELPSWLLAPMGYSGLFQRWAIPVASAITWFYDGEGGGFEYWPDGLDAPSRTEANLGSNRAVLADNEYMYHRVRQIGDPARFFPQNTIAYDARLERRDGGWRIMHAQATLADYDDAEVRLSVLWKAFCFRSRSEADAFLAGNDPLTPAQVVDLFQRDLRRRGIVLDPPSSLEGTDRWADAIRRTYAAGTPR